jgi:hypothetical protein
MTNAIATTGTIRARNDSNNAPPSSTVAMIGFPRPLVKTVE